MKKLTLFYLIALCGFASSCASTIQFVRKQISYTTAERLYKTKLGISYEELKANLMNVEPVSMLYNDANGTKVLVYTYFTKQRFFKISSAKIDQTHDEASQNASEGEVSYIENQRNAYVIFKDNKVSAIMNEDEFNGGASLNLLNNNLNALSKGEVQQVMIQKKNNADKPMTKPAQQLQPKSNGSSPILGVFGL